MKKEVSKAKALIEEMAEKLVETQNEVRELKTKVDELERNQRNRRGRRQSTSSTD